MNGWHELAERAAKARGEAILERIRAAITDHAADAETTAGGDEVRAQGRGLKRRWINEPGLRFARRMRP